MLSSLDAARYFCIMFSNLLTIVQMHLEFEKKEFWIIIKTHEKHITSTYCDSILEMCRMVAIHCLLTVHCIEGG